MAKIAINDITAYTKKVLNSFSNREKALMGTAMAADAADRAYLNNIEESATKPNADISAAAKTIGMLGWSLPLAGLALRGIKYGSPEALALACGLGQVANISNVQRTEKFRDLHNEYLDLQRKQKKLEKTSAIEPKAVARTVLNDPRMPKKSYKFNYNPGVKSLLLSMITANLLSEASDIYTDTHVGKDVNTTYPTVLNTGVAMSGAIPSLAALNLNKSINSFTGRKHLSPVQIGASALPLAVSSAIALQNMSKVKDNKRDKKFSTYVHL